MKNIIRKSTKVLAVVMAIMFALSSFSAFTFAAEKDCNAYIKLTSSKTNPKPGDKFTVTISAKTDYPVINVNTIIVYDARYYELDTSSGATVKKATNMPVSLNQTTASPLAMYHQSYSKAMTQQYKLVFAGITWLPSLSSQGTATPTTTLTEFTNLYTVNFKMKKSAPTDGNGFLGVDPVYLKNENDSMRSGIYAAHGGATLGDDVIASYGQKFDFSQAVVFGTEVEKMAPDYTIEMNYKSAVEATDVVGSSKKLDWLSADNSIVEARKTTLNALKTGKTYVAGVSEDGKTYYNAEVTVKYSLLQWFIIIFLFGWLWY
ncbi:MAG: hypothetical protein E7536_02575 [Ruminococcaceae bacterium]|nr:hypothetical protein [Oscillospiraceae bacterium]